MNKWWTKIRTARYHRWLCFWAWDSYGNRYVRVEVAGGGRAPIWKFREWWSGTTISIHSADRKKDYLYFDFPESSLADVLGNWLANLLDQYFRIVYWVQEEANGS